MFLADSKFKNLPESKPSSDFWPFDPGINKIKHKTIPGLYSRRKVITDGNIIKGSNSTTIRLWGTASSFRRCHYTPDRQKAGGTSGDRTAIWGRAVKQCIVCRGRLPELKWIFAVFWSAVETFADKGRYQWGDISGTGRVKGRRPFLRRTAFCTSAALSGWIISGTGHRSGSGRS